MKEYKHNEELIEHLKNKNVIIDDENIALTLYYFNYKIKSTFI